MQDHSTRQRKHEPSAIELWVHPVSGETCRRQSLGSCRSGRLALKRCGETGGVNLFWFSTNGGPAADTFDSALQQLMPDGQPVLLDHGLYWIGRLAAADYRLEDRDGGGMALFRLLWGWQVKQPARRQTPLVTAKGNQLVKMR